MNRKLGLIFDLDGTAVDSEGLNARAAAKGFEDLLGISGMGEEDFVKGIGMGLVAYVKAGATARGQTLTEEQVRSLVGAWEDNAIAILETEFLPRNPGVSILMKNALEDPSFSVAIGTSCSRRLSTAMMKAAKIPYDQMVFVCGDDVTEKKPNPGIFHEVCSRLELPTSQCCVLEDSPAGVEAARRAGCKCIALESKAFSREKLAAANQVVFGFDLINLETVRTLLAA